MLCHLANIAFRITNSEYDPNLYMENFVSKETIHNYKACHIVQVNSSVFVPGAAGTSEATEQYMPSLYRNFANLLLTKSVLHLHSSFVLYNGRALVFTGPSGIGKTTQAELWRDFQGAEIINGDACLLRELEDGWHAFGTPVHGSSPYCENKDAPLAALVALEQGPENRLERLDSFAALTACLPEFYRPQMDPATQDIFWGAVDSLFRKTPVYRLVCRPDRDATELVKRTVFPAG